eukprot:gene9247-9413_t
MPWAVLYAYIASVMVMSMTSTLWLDGEGSAAVARLATATGLPAWHAFTADIAVVEGVMGLFDSSDGGTEDGSTAQIAKWLGVPVLLVVDCWCLARSAAAMVKGYAEFDPELPVQGLLLNKVGSTAHGTWLKQALASAFDMGHLINEVQVLGCLPKDEAISVPERHLGLTMPLEQQQQHHELWRSKLSGAELVFFSPLRDQQLPSGACGVYLGGGYPERHVDQLGSNSQLMQQLREFAAAHGPVYAECGVLPFAIRMGSMKMGYVEGDVRAAQRVVGVSSFCDSPLEALEKPVVVRSMIDVGSMTSDEIEAAMQGFKATGQSPFLIDRQLLQQERPGLVLTQDACGTCDADCSLACKALQEAGLTAQSTQVLVLHPKTLREVFDSITAIVSNHTCKEWIGAASNQLLQQEELDRQDKQPEQQAGPPGAPGAAVPRVLSLEGLNPLVLGGQWLPDVKLAAGCLDASGQEAGAQPQRVTWNQVLDFAPDVLLLCPCSRSPTAAMPDVQALTQMPGFLDLPAVRAGKVFVVDHSLFSRPSPRLLEGIELLAHIAHGVVVGQGRKLYESEWCQAYVA